MCQVDNPFGSGQSGRIGMRSHLFTALVCLPYLSVALVFGVVHHHEHDSPLGDHHDCAACAWHINAVTDVPLTTPLVVSWVIETPWPVFDVTVFAVSSLAFSLSRAPPVTPA